MAPTARGQASRPGTTLPASYVIEVLFFGALALGVAALAGLALAARGAARVAWWLAAGGHAVLVVAAAVTAVRGRESLDPVVPLGVLASLLGFALACALDLRGRVHPARAGLVLLAGWIGAMVLGGVDFGSLALAASWCALARLAQESGTPAVAAQRLGVR
jgi:hypothetical protein